MALVLSASPALAGMVNAVASFSILGDMVQRVGGDRVVVSTIVGPNADAHVHEPTPRDAAALAGSDIFFINGLGFEGWLERLVQSTKYQGPVIVVSQGIDSREMADAGETGADPHAWQSLANGQLYVKNIVAGLCGVDQAGCAAYTANAASYAAEMEALDAEARAKIAALPAARRKVITTHDAFGYFGEEYGVRFLAPEGVSTESEASAAGVAQLIAQIRAEGVTALFIENMTDGRLMAQIAKETGAQVGGELYADALSEPGQGAASYLEMFRHNIDLLMPAMSGE